MCFSPFQIIADYAAVKGKSFKPTYVTIADAEKSLEGQPPMSVFRDRLMILQASGKSQVVPNANWPNVVATPEDFKYFFGKK